MSENQLPNEFKLTSPNNSNMLNFFPAKTTAELQTIFQNKIWRSTPQSAPIINTNEQNNYLFKDEIPVFCHASCKLSELESQASALMQSKLNLAIYSELRAKIQHRLSIESYDYIPNDLIKLPVKKVVPSDTTQVTKAQVTNTQEYNSYDEKYGHWLYKSTLSYGALAIYGDMVNAISAMTMITQNNSQDFIKNTTLILPASKIAEVVSQTGTNYSPFNIIQATFPKLKIATIPELVHDDDKFALLISDDPIYGKPGYLALKNQVKLYDRDEVDNGTIRYKLLIPAYKLVITNPSQIAILTGI